ncbi:uncharacterized protein [Vicugna pacos]|uniref:Uncharacterized protein isoform X2 n=1 Tax=Vicugna pacos TaxID=30538 RepID=A0ABM5DB02_VICPA
MALGNWTPGLEHSWQWEKVPPVLVSDLQCHPGGPDGPPTRHVFIHEWSTHTRLCGGGQGLRKAQPRARSPESDGSLRRGGSSIQGDGARGSTCRGAGLHLAVRLCGFTFMRTELGNRPFRARGGSTWLPGETWTERSRDLTRRGHRGG